MKHATSSDTKTVGCRCVSYVNFSFGLPFSHTRKKHPFVWLVPFSDLRTVCSIGGLKKGSSSSGRRCHHRQRRRRRRANQQYATGGSFLRLYFLRFPFHSYFAFAPRMLRTLLSLRFCNICDSCFARSIRLSSASLFFFFVCARQYRWRHGSDSIGRQK